METTGTGLTPAEPQDDLLNAAGGTLPGGCGNMERGLTMAFRSTGAMAAPGSEDARARILAEAAAILGMGDETGAFVQDLFGRVPTDDVVCYDAGSLAELASAARDHLSDPGGVEPTGRVRLRDVVVVRDGRPVEITVLEAVNWNRPFLLDSTLAELGDRGLTPMLVAHPILGVDRDPAGGLLEVVGETAAGRKSHPRRESLIHIHLDRLDAEPARDSLVDALGSVYADVAAAMEDRDAMWSRVSEVAAQLRGAAASGSDAGAAEAADFLDWLGDGQFVLLGLAEGAASGVPPTTGRPTRLGILRHAPAASDVPPPLDQADRAFLDQPSILAVTKSGARSRVHRSARLDDIRAKRSSAGGSAGGLTRVVGLFTATAYNSPTRQMPLVRTKISLVVERAGLDPTSHAGRMLLAVLNAYPRDELFQAEPDALLRDAMAIVGLADRPRVRVLHRIDTLGRFASIIAYTFKDRTNARVRARIGEHLAAAFGGRVVESQPDFPEGVLARTRFVVALDGQGASEPDRGLLERGVAAIARSWEDELRAVLADGVGGGRSRALAARYADAFSAGYRERFPPAVALGDVGIIEALSAEAPRAAHLGRGDGDDAAQLRLRLFSLGRPIPLSDRVPALEHLGFRVIDERTYSVRRAGADPAGKVWIHDMLIERATGAPVNAASVAGRLRDTLLALLEGRTEADGFNGLVLDAGLDWREAALVRAFGRYLRQLRVPHGQDYMASALVANPAVARDLVALFRARFDPLGVGDRPAAEAGVRARVETALTDVRGLDEDRILRRFLNLVTAAVRTNFFQVDRAGHPREAITIKFACAQVAGMPLPRPLFETFVTSPRVEGLHLRFGHVARGGLRWSDRPEDLRTEVLGLVKAQQVKNAVIVPVGAKGGFIVKRPVPLSGLPNQDAGGEAAYRLFVGSLLDVTDNIVEAEVVAPARTVRHDTDDAYLVVAADKGTAAFSDLANSVSLSRGHWLGDAFASGGSHGYDHKAMGITARGAWEAVKRHFREIEVDADEDPITVAGVGDMSGDVFGNGMLMSRALRLVAAFDHRHVFLDPSPDPGASHAERRRLHGIGTSSWADYDPGVVSPGGGVFDRSAKSIPVSSEVRRVLGFDREHASPADLIQAILRAPVDLLWFGGVGTFVRAASETEEQAGDRANDALRVTAVEVRAKVVGEGANLGLTQRARVEASLAGVRLNTDAIDNSAGVNTSDLEVNIKIALMGPERDGRLDARSRTTLLSGMTGDVGALVLRNNRAQALALSLAANPDEGESAFASRAMQALEAEGRLSRELEFLPDDGLLTERVRAGGGLTRPEFAVLMAYAKTSLYDALLDCDLPDDPHLGADLARYFPSALGLRFPEEIAGHRLRREIIATELANAVINDCGITVVSRLSDDAGADSPAVARAYVAARDLLGAERMRDAIDKMDGPVSGRARLALYDELRHLLLGVMTRLLRGPSRAASIGHLVSGRRDDASRLLAGLPGVLGEDWTARGRREHELIGAGLPTDAARLLVAGRAVSEMPVILDVADAQGRDALDVASTHFAVGRALDLDRLTAAARCARARDDFDRIALARSSATLEDAHREMTVGVLGVFGAGREAVERWMRARGDAMARIEPLLGRITGSGMTVAMATVAANSLSELASFRPMVAEGPDAAKGEGGREP